MLAPGERIADRYRILDFLAAGGMGAVHAAFDEALGEKIALKTLVADLFDDRRVERFRTEVKALRWREDIDLVAGTITVNQQIRHGVVGTPKGRTRRGCR